PPCARAAATWPDHARGPAPPVPVARDPRLAAADPGQSGEYLVQRVAHRGQPAGRATKHLCRSGNRLQSRSLPCVPVGPWLAGRQGLSRLAGNAKPVTERRQGRVSGPAASAFLAGMGGRAGLRRLVARRFALSAGNSCLRWPRELNRVQPVSGVVYTFWADRPDVLLFRRRVPRAACYLSAAVAGSGWLAANHGGGAVRTRLATAAVPIPGRRNPIDRRRLDDGSRAGVDWRHRVSSADCGSSLRGHGWLR